MKTDIEIAQQVVIRPIVEIAEKLGINPDELEWSFEKKMRP